MATRCGIKLHIFHVAGTRMIAQGTDDVSRGYLANGVLAGDAMSSYIPIHLSAMARLPSLIEWMHSWYGPDAVEMKLEAWSSEGHDIAGWRMNCGGFERPILKEGRTYLWLPPPFAANVAIAELRKAQIKRQSSTHVFVCPRLCSPLWPKTHAVGRQMPLCSKRRTWTHAIFCANFGCNVTGSGIFRTLWCGGCYTSALTPDLYVTGNMSERATEEEDQDRIK
jgi:hypothetical protein